MRNLPSLSDVASGDAVRGLSLDAIDALLLECETQTKLAAAAKKAIVAHLEHAFSGDIAHAYSVQGKDFGSVRISDGGYELVVETPKKVDWDQDELCAVVDRIRASGDDPSEYVDAKFSIEERRYTAWPEHIRKVFEPARTTKPGTRTIKLVRKEAA